MDNTGASDADEAVARAIRFRAQWMREIGVSEEEITELCNAKCYPADADEEAANLSAVRRMRSR